MSEENVERLRAAYAEWGKGNLIPGGEIYAPDAVFVPMGEGREAFDLEGFVRFMHEFLVQWDDFSMEATDFLDAGDKVLVTETQRATGKRSRIELDQKNYAVWTFRSGLVTSVRWEIEENAARQLAGLGD
jgi:ketosteroid isomerase-like protein